MLKLAVLFTPLLAFAQLESYTVTAGATRVLHEPPDQVTFNVRLITGFDTTLDEVLSALQPASISAANLAQVYRDQTYDQNNVETDYPVWSFNLTLPLVSANSQIVALSKLADSIQSLNNGWELFYSVNGLTNSPQTTPQCSIPDLLSDARAQAQNLAGAIGFGVGPILAMGDESQFSRIFSPGTGYGSPSAGAPIGVFGGIDAVISSPAAGVFCGIVVKFRLIQGI
jgi:hypothetical protein